MTWFNQDLQKLACDALPADALFLENVCSMVAHNVHCCTNACCKLRCANASRHVLLSLKNY